MKQETSHPYAGRPRRFLALAMPNGDQRCGVEGPLVMLIEKRASGPDKLRMFTRDEAAQLARELEHALGAFEVAKDLAGAVACRSPYPFRDHRTMAEIAAAQAEGA